ncbi:TetR/AcrR family transcriptional regulator [Nocardia sp. NPDC050799]|uniref:TetR/AcrR family transcriptional regulator n=1 Tax=Nocardia sp. NPDC050799 TaxID=3154842 RepID=UPI0033E13907
MRFEQTLALLWGDDSKRVGRSGLTIADYITTATALLDETGAGGLSMRAVAERLGVRTMAAYSFGNKEDLVALIVDRVCREAYPSGAGPRAGNWRTGLAEVAHANRRLELAHPWLPELQTVRSLMGPCELRKRDLELHPLESTGLSDLEKDQVLTQLLLHVSGTTRIETALQRERADSGLTDDQWWRVVMPILESIADPAEFPIAARVGLAVQADRNGQLWGEATFGFGLERLLDGFATLIARHTANQD